MRKFIRANDRILHFNSTPLPLSITATALTGYKLLHVEHPIHQAKPQLYMLQ